MPTSILDDQLTYDVLVGSSVEWKARGGPETAAGSGVGTL